MIFTSYQNLLFTSLLINSIQQFSPLLNYFAIEALNGNACEVLIFTFLLFAPFRFLVTVPAFDVR